jgi:hypothetical protein
MEKSFTGSGTGFLELLLSLFILGGYFAQAAGTSGFAGFWKPGKERPVNIIKPKG